jgi:hypothetical protein
LRIENGQSQKYNILTFVLLQDLGNGVKNQKTIEKEYKTTDLTSAATLVYL